MTDSPYNFKTRLEGQTYKYLRFENTSLLNHDLRLKKTDFSENLLSSFTLVKFIGQEA